MSDLPHYSYSQVNTWLGCEQRWFWNYFHELVPITTARFFQVGTLVHEMFDTYYQGILNEDYIPGQWFIWDKLLPRVASDLEGKISVDDAMLYSICLQVLKKYVLDYSPVADKNITVVNTEFIIEQPLVTPQGRNFIFEGYIDLLYQLQGKLYIVDHKSSGQPGWWSDRQYETFIQLSLYSSILRLMGIYADYQVINHINTYNYKNYWAEPVDKLFHRKTLVRSSHEQSAVLRNFSTTVDRIETAKRSEIPFTPIKNLSTECSRCPYQSLCVYELKGIPTDGLIATKFTTKTARAARTDSH